MLDELGLTDEFDLMIDASAGDLWSDGRYELAITDQSAYSSDAFCDYWLRTIGDYALPFLEDPFRELDGDAWARLTAAQQACALIGDNLYSSDARRISEGAAAGLTRGAIVKPNQAGTVTAVYDAIAAARAAGQLVITSHRSISTESLFEATVSCVPGADLIKIGPLFTDYSSVIRLNEIIRLTGERVVSERTVITTMRHGETTWGPLRRYAGSIDVPLSDAGRRGCEEAARVLAEAAFDVVITSHLQRARETARLVCPDLTCHVQTRLCRERGFGAMEGLTWDEVRALDPPILFIEVGGDLHSVNPPGGEPFEDVWQRAKRFRAMVFRRYGGRRVLVVSHGVFLQMFHGVLRGSTCIESLAEYPGNLELTRFEFDDRRLVAQEVVRVCGETPGF